jgi:Tol biopolymer transport system component
MLQGLNTAAFDETEPDLSGDARWIAYVTDRGDGSRLGLYDVTTGADFALPGADRGFIEVHNPRFFAKNRRIAFSASTALPDGRAGTLDIYIYDLTTGSLWQPPFVNSPFDEDSPDLSDDGARMLFDSNRFGSKDLFEANLATGVTHHLSFADTAAFDERSPRYYGKDDAWIRFKLNPAPSADPSGFLLRVYHPREGVVDTLSVPNQLLRTPLAGP